MTEAEAQRAVRDLLDRLGVAAGATIFLGIDMGRLPLPHYPAALTRDAIQQREQQWCAFLLAALRAAVAPAGTLIVPTYSYRCTNPKNAFVLEDTPSEVGRFTEFVRLQPGARRSLHPVFSVTALGPRASELVDAVGGSAFGPASPFGRLAGARLVCLGVPFHRTVTYMHHMEQCHGSPHRYHKNLMAPVFAQGRRVERRFQAYLRFLGVDAAADLRRVERRLVDAGAMVEVPWGGGVSHAADVSDVDRIGYAMLAEDPFAFSSRPLLVEHDASAVDKPSAAERVTFRLVPDGDDA